MEALSVREYRNNLAASFTKADNGEQVLIRRKNEIYALVKVGREDLMITPELQARIDKAREEIKKTDKRRKLWSIVTCRLSALTRRTKTKKGPPFGRPLFWNLVPRLTCMVSFLLYVFISSLSLIGRLQR